MADAGFYFLAGRLLQDLLQGKGTVSSLALGTNVRNKKKMVAILSETYKCMDTLPGAQPGDLSNPNPDTDLFSTR
jgi:hypothetical protein